MNKDILTNRVLELRAALDQSLTNHNALAGRLAEAEFILAKMIEAEKTE